MLLVVLAAWGLAIILPELTRVVGSLASYGFSADNNGVIFDVVAPFPTASQSPAARAGLVPGDRLDLARMRCTDPTSEACADIVGVLGGFGGLQYARPGGRITLAVLPAHGGAPRIVRLAAALAPLGWSARLVLLADTIVGALFIAVAVHLVWTRPSWMTWGFFLYAMWFNPGQTYTFYALIGPWPPAVLAEQFVEALAQGAGYAGLLAFALRFPTGEADPPWSRLEPGLPWLGGIVAAATLLGAGNFFGFPTERIIAPVFLCGYLIDAAVILVLVLRMRHLPPQDEQRMRWAIAGCAIGLPGFIFAELCQSSSVFYDLWGSVPSQAVIGLLYLLHGVIAYFVGTAVRRRRVVSVAIPLRRGAVLTALTFVVGVPILYLHEKVATAYEGSLHLAGWIWPAFVGPIALLALTRLHETAVDLMERAFNRRYHRAQHQLQHAGQAALEAEDFAAIDRLLAEVPVDALSLSSAAVFRWMDGTLHRAEPAIGWGPDGLVALERERDGQVFASFAQGAPVPLPRGRWQRPGLPGDDLAPCLAVPICGGAVEGIAVALFGPHLTGTDINEDERELLRAFAARVAIGYDRVETELLRREVRALRTALAALGAPKLATPPA